MKIGIFSDVHGHLDELKKTLALFERLQVDEIVCGGDLVDKGLHSDGVIDLMRERQIICVQGNHDAKAQYIWFHYAEPLQPRSVEYLSKLPKCLMFEWAGVSVYLCHANPWEDPSIYIYPTRPLVLFQEVAKSVDSDIIIMGHTHQPMRVEVDSKLLLNPGSVYGNRDMEQRTCGVLSLPDARFEIYDIDTGQKLCLW